VQALVQAAGGGVSVLGDCARLRPLSRSPLLTVDLWRCVRDGDGLREERTHRSPVMAVVLSGASVLRIEGAATIIEAGTALFVDADRAYRTAHPFGCDDMGCHVRPSEALLDELQLGDAPWRSAPLPPRAHLRFRLAVERAIAGGDLLELEEAALFLLEAAAVPDDRPRPTARHAALVEDAKALLLDRFRDALSMADVGRAVGASPYHLARVFRRHTGLSLHGYRTRLRLLSALERIGDARGCLADLALDLGFSSQSHFTDAFRAAFGVAPGKVRTIPTARSADDH
jgi:AraC-like DNA-binding protein